MGQGKIWEAALRPVLSDFTHPSSSNTEQPRWLLLMRKQTAMLLVLCEDDGANMQT